MSRLSQTNSRQGLCGNPAGKTIRSNPPAQGGCRMRGMRGEKDGGQMRDCKHGQLARSCELCQMQHDLDEALEALRSADAALCIIPRTRKHGWLQDAAHKKAQAVLSSNAKK